MPPVIDMKFRKQQNTAEIENKLDQYTIVRILGSGAYGVVKLAQNRITK